MIKYIEGDIFDSPAQVIVNTVNTVGVMGKGLALSFKQRYPEMFAAYRTACEKHQLTIGKLMLWHAPDHWLLLFPTKENWRHPSRIEYIEKGLNKFVNTYAERNINSIAFPRLGCGNGELNWTDVKPLMEKYLALLPIDIYIYLGLKPEPVPEHKTPKKTLDWIRTYAKDISFNGIKDDIIFNSSIMPYSFNLEDKTHQVRWENGLSFIDDQQNEDFLVNEDAFFEIWDEIRNKGVFPSPTNDPQRILIYAMLSTLGYLSEIRIKDDKTQQMISGYQVKEGSGRMYSLKGNI